MFNALFVLIVFLLQLNKDKLHVEWPLGVKTNITYDDVTQEVKFLLLLKRQPRFDIKYSIIFLPFFFVLFGCLFLYIKPIFIKKN
jgi:hypothetical protein